MPSFSRMKQYYSASFIIYQDESLTTMTQLKLNKLNIINRNPM